MIDGTVPLTPDAVGSVALVRSGNGGTIDIQFGHKGELPETTTLELVFEKSGGALLDARLRLRKNRLHSNSASTLTTATFTAKDFVPPTVSFDLTFRQAVTSLQRGACTLVLTTDKAYTGSVGGSLMFGRGANALSDPGSAVPAVRISGNDNIELGSLTETHLTLDLDASLELEIVGGTDLKVSGVSVVMLTQASASPFANEPVAVIDLNFFGLQQPQGADTNSSTLRLFVKDQESYSHLSTFPDSEAFYNALVAGLQLKHCYLAIRYSYLANDSGRTPELVTYLPVERRLKNQSTE